MTKPRVTDDEFLAAWAELQSPQRVANRLGLGVRTVYAKRRALETRRNTTLLAQSKPAAEANGSIQLNVSDGCVIVFSDAHYWPGEPSTAHRGLLALIRELHPAVVINNGDAFDGARASRHPRIGWDKTPTIVDELKAVSERLAEIEEAAAGARRCWNLGNHDLRFESTLAAHAGDFEGVTGFRLRDHFPRWETSWVTWINGKVAVKHRWHNGVHAAYNNTLKSGASIVTGHLHRLKVEPFSDYNGRRWGVDTGTLAAPYGPQFSEYTELSPVNWTAGFAVLSFHGGALLEPEIATVFGPGRLSFRGVVREV